MNCLIKIILIVVVINSGNLNAGQYKELGNDQLKDSIQTVLITGANRGLGLEFAKQFSSMGYKVIGTARNPDKAVNLKKLTVEVFQLDVTDADSVLQLSKSLNGRPIDILINNAGYLSSADMSLDKVSFELLEKTFAINTLGPLRVVKSLIGNVKAGQDKKVINISSRLGSISQSTGRMYSYRTSKSALNQINKILSVEFKEESIIFTVLHPGWVQTDMGGPKATYTPEESVSGMIKVIDTLTMDNSGYFYDLKGEAIPW